MRTASPAESIPTEPDLDHASEGSLVIRKARKFQGSSGPSVAIIGAGVCGLGIGWRLAEAGCAVTVFDRGRAGQGATWAAAGMLAAGVECEPGEEALLEITLAQASALPPELDAFQALLVTSANGLRAFAAASARQARTVS